MPSEKLSGVRLRFSCMALLSLVCVTVYGFKNYQHSYSCFKSKSTKSEEVGWASGVKNKITHFRYSVYWNSVMNLHR